MRLEFDIFIMMDIIISIAVIVVSVLYLKSTPKNYKFRSIKIWHIFNAGILAIMLLSVLFGVAWPYWSLYVMIGLILANNFAATLTSYSKLQSEKLMVKKVLSEHAKSNNGKEMESWEAQNLSQSQQQ